MLSCISCKCHSCFVEHEVEAVAAQQFPDMLSLVVASLGKHRGYSSHDLTAIRKINTHPLFFSRSLILLPSLHPTVRWLHNSHHLRGNAAADTLSPSAAGRKCHLSGWSLKIELSKCHFRGKPKSFLHVAGFHSRSEELKIADLSV